MPDAVTPPNPDQSGSGQHGAPPQSVPDPTLMTIDALRREIAMLENLLTSRIDAESELTRERFHRVDQTMDRGEGQRQEQKADTKAAVDAALASQKEATAKMESATGSQLASLRDNFATSIAAVQSNVADLKDRMTILESVNHGMTAQRSESRQVNAGTVAAIGVGVAILVAAMTVLSFVAGGA